jgi:hypothetical protein
MKNTASPSGASASLPRFAALALCAVLLIFSLPFSSSKSSAQRRVAVRLPPGEVNQPRAKGRGEREERRRARNAQDATRAHKPAVQESNLKGVPQEGAPGVERSTAEIMIAQENAPAISRAPRLMVEHELPDRTNLPQDPDSPAVSSTAASAADTSPVRKGSATVKGAPPAKGLVGTKSAGGGTRTAGAADAPQTVSTTNFTGATLADTGAFPPDSMGTIGPAQFVVFVNGRLRTFNKATGAADGVINADPDVFFSSVMTPVSGGSLNTNFTSDPMVRYDRLTARWFLTIIDVPNTNAIGDTPNRVLIAVSDAASNGVISASTVWTYYFVQQDMVGTATTTGEFLDYPSLGIDNNALYIGGNMFDAVSGNFNGCSAFVIRKSSVLSGGPVVATAFRGLVPDPNTTDGMLTPRGVDNYDPAATEGYFIGVSNAAFGRLIFRRVSNPGGTPTISADILITVSSTAFPIPVAHLGNTAGNNGRLDSLDDRLYQAQIRGGKLWTAHNIGVTATGVAGGTTTATGTKRDAVRWYELNVPPATGTPTVVESGTIFDNATNVTTARQYWIPSVAISGQGHAAFGYSTAGTTFPIDTATNGRLRTDTLGTTGTVALYTNATGNAYNPSSDPGGTAGRRWGDYSFTSVDPQDDMTMWTIQEFCSSPNNYGVRVVKLNAPPPAAPNSASPTSVPAGQSSVNVTITGTSVGGSEFFDPGANLAAPALPFNHIAATVSGGVIVNSVTYTDPTHVTLNLDTSAAPNGAKNVTITNPDGQGATASGVFYVGAQPASPLIISEFRFTGSAGGNDEFIELYNNTNSPIVVADTNGGTGYAVVATNTTGTFSTRFTVPNGTVIPARGHYLGVNNGASGYSLGGYAAGDATYATGIVPGGGVAVFTTTTAASWGTNTRLDAAGFTGITGTTLFTEGAGLSPGGGVSASGEYSFVRKLATGLPQDTNDNASDFAFVSTTGTIFNTLQSALGAPGPENMSSPAQGNSGIKPSLIDPGCTSMAINPAATTACSLERQTTAVTNGALGTLAIRRKFTNSTGAPVTRLRFRIVDVTTLNSPGYTPGGAQADLRALSSATVAGVPLSGGGTTTLDGLTLDATPAQAAGGGFNSTLSAGTITLGSPLAPGSSVNLSFLLGVQQPGFYRFFINVESQ